MEGGFIHSGDLARIDDDGYYWFVGRKKEIIIRAGSNISPLEVEEAGAFETAEVSRSMRTIEVPRAAVAGGRASARVAQWQSRRLGNTRRRA
jgi:acyl-CoA synthetase (AMP-forming)/AMP-acid ligase II